MLFEMRYRRIRDSFNLFLSLFPIFCLQVENIKWIINDFQSKPKRFNKSVLGKKSDGGPKSGKKIMMGICGEAKKKEGGS